MKSTTNDTREAPEWKRSGQAAALIVQCARCFHHPGSGYDDGSGVCNGCQGSGWKVLALAYEGAITR